MNRRDKTETPVKLLNDNEGGDDDDDTEHRFFTSTRLFSRGTSYGNDVKTLPFLPKGGKHPAALQSSSKMSTALELSVAHTQQQSQQQRFLTNKTTTATSLIAANQQQQEQQWRLPKRETSNANDTKDTQFLRIRWTDVLLRKNIKNWRALESYHEFVSRHLKEYDTMTGEVVSLPVGFKLGGSGGSAAAANNKEDYDEFSADVGYGERNYYTYERLNEKQRRIYQAIMRMNESYDPNKEEEEDYDNEDKGDCKKGSAAALATDAAGNANNNYDNNDDYDPSYMGDVVLIQAPPGTGKTHVMLTTAHQLMMRDKNLPYVIIFKNGLIYRYRYCAAGFSVAKFCMYAFGLRSLETFKGVERVINRLDSVECIINNVLQLTRQFKPYDSSRNTLFEVRGNVLLFDEYTVITKIILLAVLFAGKLHNLKYVFCGDRNQLGCIRSSMHTHSTSSYDIISSFTNNVFSLDTCVRCVDDDYNGKISLIGRMASDELLGDRGNAIVAALFLPHMLRSIDRYDTIIMRNHRALSHTIYIESLKQMARNNTPDYAVSFWILEKRMNEVKGQLSHDNCYIPNPVFRFYSALKAAEDLKSDASAEQRAAVQCALQRDVPGKHLPFLVLNVGGIYYYETMSDSSLCVLREIRFKQGTGEPERITVDLVDENLQPRNISKLLYRHTPCNNVMFSQHLNYLTNDGCDEKPGAGILINFPIYPKFIMTTYMSQGCTISTRVSFNTVDCSYKCLYVMMSRVRSPDNINAVSVPNHFSHLVSVLMNFDVTRYNNVLPVSEIEDKLLNGVYVMYQFCHQDLSKTRALNYAIQQILDTQKPQNERYKMLQQLRAQIAGSELRRINISPITATSSGRGIDNHNPVLYQNTMNFMLCYKTVMMGLVQLTQYEATVWLRAFLQRIEISSRFSHTLFSTRDEYNTTSLRFEHLFESDSDYKLLTGINIVPLSRQQQQQQQQTENRWNSSSARTTKAPLPSPVAMLFCQHVRRITTEYWRRHGSSITGHKNTNTVDDDNDDVDDYTTEGISLDTLRAESDDYDNATCKQQQKNVQFASSSIASEQVHAKLQTSCGGSSKGAANSKGKRKNRNAGNETKNTAQAKRQKQEEYLAAEEAFLRCETLADLLVARLNL